MTHEPFGRWELMRRPAAGPTSPALPQVRLVADLVCPWCYIGFHRLMGLAERRPFELVWHPFLLNPHLPPEGVARAAYVERRFGAGDGGGLADAVHRRAAAAAAGEALEVRLERIARQPSTLAAHALLLEAGARAPLLARALFEAFFRDGLDIGSRPVLAGLAERLGIDAGRALDSPDSGAAVRAAHETACAAGIDGVPVFLFGGDHVIAGAQPAACLGALLDLERYRLARAAAGDGGGRDGAQGRQAS